MKKVNRIEIKLNKTSCCPREFKKNLGVMTLEDRVYFSFKLEALE